MHEVVFAEGAFKIYDRLPRNLKERVNRVIEERLEKEPFLYGEPLRYGFIGFWKIRTGKLRIIYKPEDTGRIVITDMDFRKEVYGQH
ncbi:MAG: type II toxin-antitoxin system RelE/ParE family toxin [Elusimicrobiales bacterium]